MTGEAWPGMTTSDAVYAAQQQQVTPPPRGGCLGLTLVVVGVAAILLGLVTVYAGRGFDGAMP